MTTMAAILAEEQANTANWVVRVEFVEVVPDTRLVTTGTPPDQITRAVITEYSKIAVRIFKLDSGKIKEDTEYYLVKDYGQASESATKMK